MPGSSRIIKNQILNPCYTRTELLQTLINTKIWKSAPRSLELPNNIDTFPIGIGALRCSGRVNIYVGGHDR